MEIGKSKLTNQGQAIPKLSIVNVIGQFGFLFSGQDKQPEIDCMKVMVSVSQLLITVVLSTLVLCVVKLTLKSWVLSLLCCIIDFIPMSSLSGCSRCSEPHSGTFHKGQRAHHLGPSSRAQR